MAHLSQLGHGMLGLVSRDPPCLAAPACELPQSARRLYSYADLLAVPIDR